MNTDIRSGFEMDFLPANYKPKKQKKLPKSEEEIKKIVRKEKANIDANIEASAELLNNK